jgi:hypothetical protein
VADPYGLQSLIGRRIMVQHDDGLVETGTVTGLPAWSEEYVLVETSRGVTCRNGVRLMRQLPPQRVAESSFTREAQERLHHPQPNRREAALPATAEKSPARKKPAQKSKLAKAKEKDDAALAKFLLANPTYSDATWSDRAGGRSRRKGESRESFVRRVLG